MAKVRQRTIEDNGERMIPEFHHSSVMYAEHMVRYLFASRFVAGKTVLDVASGVGYGSDMLKAAGAAQVIGVDRSSDAVAYGATHHATSQPDYLLASAGELPLLDGQFDVVVSFETIEHVPDHHRFLTEVKRVLHPDGLFLVSTPNKGIYIEGNPFHTKEFTFTEFEGLLDSFFGHVETLAQDNWITSAIFAPSTHEKADRPIAGRLKGHKAVGKPAIEALYMVSICSDAPLPRAGQCAMLTGLYEMRSYLVQIAQLNTDNARLEGAVRERDGLIAERDEHLAESGRRITDLEYRLSATERELRQAWHAFESVTSTLGYRSVERLRAAVRWLFPPGSWRRRPYRAIRRLTGGGADSDPRQQQAPEPEEESSHGPS